MWGVVECSFEEILNDLLNLIIDLSECVKVLLYFDQYLFMTERVMMN
jgi:hypothetical protein